MALSNFFKKKNKQENNASVQQAQQSVPQPPQNKPVETGANLKSALKSVVTNTKPDFPDPVAAFTDKSSNLIDIIAPPRLEIEVDYLKIGNVFLRSFFISGYPRFVGPGWLEQIVNFNSSLDISFFIYPIEGKGVLDDLMRKIAEMEAEISTDLERGKIINPGTSAKLEDARLLQEELVKGAEHYFEFGFYITVRA